MYAAVPHGVSNAEWSAREVAKPKSPILMVAGDSVAQKMFLGLRSLCNT